MATITVNPRRKKATKVLARKAFTDELARRAKPKAKRGKASSWVFSMLLTEHIKEILDGKVVTAVSKTSGKTHHIGLA